MYRFMKKSLISTKKILASLCVVLAVAALPACLKASSQQRYEASYFDAFDTVTVIMGYADSKEQFDEYASAAHSELVRLHRLFDIYNDYDGINNLKTVNDSAGVAPVEVDESITDLLGQCIEMYTTTKGYTNIAMGPVLRLWHNCREAADEDPESAALPDAEELTAAAEHCAIDNIVVDYEASTVYISDASGSIDVGAVAKGYAAQKAAKLLPSGYLLDAGGNVCAIGTKPDETSWSVGVRDPFSSQGDYLHVVSASDISVVTSGSYERYYTVNGHRYGHIINPDTLYPAELYEQVTVISQNGTLADALSTALFCMPLDEGMRLVNSLDGVEALWVGTDGAESSSDGFNSYVK